MKAELNADGLQIAFATVSKGIRGKHLQERAKALLTFRADDVCVDFNDVSASCPAIVSKPGKYVLNPFIFRALLETYGILIISIEIDETGLTFQRSPVGRLRLAHIRVHGRFDYQQAALDRWERVKTRDHATFYLD
jgi:hypothetical protein